MMFQNKFVCAVKVNGKILRESSNLVTLPFGAEYEILLKNLNSRRAMVKVSVDGQDATEGTRLILQPNSSLTLQRFIRNGNMSSGNRFKFIERTAGIDAHRGIKEDDGLIRAEFWAEQEKQEIHETIIHRHYINDYLPWYDPYPYPRYPRPRFGDGLTWTSNSGNLSGKFGDSNVSGLAGNFQKSAQNVSYNSSGGMADAGEPILYRRPQGGGGAPGQAVSVNRMAALNTAGITVPGSESNQQFHNAAGFPLESNSHVIVLQLRGEVGGVVVETPVTVERKPECSTCGKTNRPTNRFCDQCGTALRII